MEKKMFELADHLKSLKERKKELDAEIKTINGEIEKADMELSDMMAEMQCEKFSHSGSTFYINTRLFASPMSGRRDQLISALKQAGYGDIVTETVNANTLASFVKEQMAQNNEQIPAWLDAVVNTHEKVSVGIRRK